jgi:hypothetical protein
MAQQVTIDIVAETKKLTQGIDSANKQLGGMSKSLKTAATAAAGLASAFVLKQGISFLKDGIEEAKDAAAAMRAATATFGEGSKALEKITKDAEKFGKELAVDNDELIKLATQLGSRLPKNIQASSVELVKIFKDVEAFTGGAVSAEAAGNKLAKAFADGELRAAELTKVFPGLEQSVYAQAEALSKAGDNQGALNVLTEAGAKKYGDAAAKNVDATQKFNVALDNFKEVLGTKVLPILEKGIDFLTKMLAAFDSLPGPVQNVIIAFGAIVAIGGPLLTFVASMSTAMTTLGITSTAGAGGLNLVRVALAGLGIGLVIAALVLLIENWDEVKEAAEKLAKKLKEVFEEIYDKIKEWTGKAIDWVKENWPKLLAILTGPFGLFVLFVVKHKDEIVEKFKEVWEAVKTTVTDAVTAIVDWVKAYWNGLIKFYEDLFILIKNAVFGGFQAVYDGLVGENGIIVNLIDELGILWGAIYDLINQAVLRVKEEVIKTWNSLKGTTTTIFKGIEEKASEIWTNIKDFIIGAVQNVLGKFGEVKAKMIEVGKDIARGIAEGLTSMTGWFRTLLGSWVDSNIPGWVKSVLKIKSPSQVMMSIGENITEGLYAGMGLPGKPGINLPTINVGNRGVGGMNITINAGLGTDPIALGRQVSQALTKYGKLTV